MSFSMDDLRNQTLLAALSRQRLRGAVAAEYDAGLRSGEHGLWSFQHYTTSSLEPFNCSNCSAQGRICHCCRPSFTRFTTLSSEQEEAAAASTLPRSGNRHAASPRQFQEMESSSSGAGALATATLSEDPHTEHESGGMTANNMEVPSVAGLGLEFGDKSGTPPSISHDGAARLRNFAAAIDASGAHGEAARVLKSLAGTTFEGEQRTGSDPSLSENTSWFTNGHVHLGGQAQPDLAANGLTRVEHSREITDNFAKDPQNAQAYAKLVFTDGDLFITTHELTLGRNAERFEQYKRKVKQQKRAREELETYRKEPSQPSQPEDEDRNGDPSNSSQSLEGRPAPPSNFSEHGGPVWYPQAPHSDGEVEMQRSKPRRGISYLSKSSSTTSVAPANLHLNSMYDIPSPYNDPGVPTTCFIPIHTQLPEDISKISKEHLQFRYNFDLARWELHVKGNRAFVNDDLLERGAIHHLQHNDQIIVVTVSMVFKLPDNFRQSPGLSRGTFSQDDDEEDESVSNEDRESSARAVSTSPVRRLSNALDVDSSASEEEADEDETAAKPHRKKPSLKLKTKSAKGKSRADKTVAKKASKKLAGKKPMRRESVEDSPKASKKLEKAKKGELVEDESTKEDQADASSPPAAPFIKPGSALEGIPLGDLPEKRKGPGRPPKEGNVSKRDMALANKKRKEFEKDGKEPPAFKDLVTLVRRETKAKEMQARLIANGQLEAGAEVLPSIEPEAGSAVGNLGVAGDSATNEASRRSPPRPKRNVKALSPVKPLEECSDEDLKRPDQTYVHILDEILRNHPGDGADLPDIYARMEKRYPYYKYKCSTNGWQSSVRHNLQQSSRFKEAGKAGKGKLWTIDYDSPLEKEKKRKATPPKQPMHNGHFMPGQMPHPQYGQPQYGNQFGQHMPNGQAGFGQQPYYSPYAQQGHFGGHGTLHPPPYPARQPQHPAQAQANGLAPQFKAVVDELLLFNQRHLAAFATNPEEQERQKFLLNIVMEYISAYFHKSDPNEELRAKVASNATSAKPIYEQLEPLFRKHQPDLVVPSPFEDSPTLVKYENEQQQPTGAPSNGYGAGIDNVDSAHWFLGALNTTNSGEGQGVTATNSDGVASQSTIPQQRGTKRDATDADSEPEAKRPKSGEA